MKYCMKCGKGNPPDANFCNKCATLFGGSAQAALIPPVTQQAIPRINIEDDEEADLARRLSRLRGKKKAHVTIEDSPPLDPDEDDAESLDYVPSLQALAVEIEKDEIHRIPMDSLFPEGKTTHEAKGKTRKKKK